MTMEDSVLRRMAELRSVRARDTEIQQRKVDAAMTSFRRSLQSIKSKSEQTINSQAKLGKLKAQLREVEDHLVKALAVKTRKEANRMAIVDSLSVTKAKVEELDGVLRNQKDRKDKYAAIISQQLEALAVSEEKIKQDKANGDEIKQAFAWYNDVLGFHIEGGHGVKFTFTNINKKLPSKEYTFTVCHANNLYTLLDCDPQLNDINDLVHELNKSNDLFKFVRVMRAKFQESSTSGSVPALTSPHQDAVVLSMASPLSVVFTDSNSESPMPFGESNRDLKKPNQARRAKPSVFSPASALSRRRSPRFIGNK